MIKSSSEIGLKSVMNDKLVVYYLLSFVIVIVTFLGLMYHDNFVQKRISYFNSLIENEYKQIFISLSVTKEVAQVRSALHYQSHSDNMYEFGYYDLKIRNGISLVKKHIDVLENGGVLSVDYPVNFNNKELNRFDIEYEDNSRSKYNTDVMILKSKVLDFENIVKEFNIMIVKKISLAKEGRTEDYKNIKKELKIKQKYMAAFLQRFSENANKVFFSSQKNLTMLKSTTGNLVKGYNQRILIMTAVFLAGCFFVGTFLFFKIINNLKIRRMAEVQLNDYNERLESTVQERTLELENEIGIRENAEVQLQERVAYFELLFSCSPLAIAILDKNLFTKSVNDSFTKLFGYSFFELEGKRLYELIVPDKRYKEFDNMMDSVRNGETVTVETERMNKKGDRIIVLLMMSAIKIDGEIDGFYLIFNDITNQKIIEEKLEYQAFHDNLTGLYNRAMFVDRLKHAINLSKRDGSFKYCVCLLDIDQFKNINDKYGHHIGDGLLKAVAKKLKSALRNVDMIARLGGDEFAILIEDQNAMNYLDDISVRVHKHVSSPVEILENIYEITISMGMISSDYVTDDDALMVLRDADIAMYAAKESGKNRTVLFDEALRENVIERLNFEKEIGEGCLNDEFEFYYQPIVDINEKNVYGFEALLRWNHPEKGFLVPGKFLEVAEKSGQIVDLGYYLLKKVFHDIDLIQKKCPGVFISVNLSSKQLMDDNFLQNIYRLIKGHVHNSKYIIFEITESSLMENPKHVVNVLNEIKKLGINVAIDDFGTGYSSLSYLNTLPINIIKIDKSFTLESITSLHTRRILSSIIALGNTLDLRIIAEGVESMSHYEILSVYNCYLMQGFMFGKPVPLDDVLKNNFEEFLNMS